MSANKLIAILAIVVFIGSVLGAFFFGRASVKVEEVGEKIVRDTVWKHDTITRWYPQPTTAKAIGTQRVKAAVATSRPKPPKAEPKDSVEVGRIDSTSVAQRDSVQFEVRDLVEVDLPIEERTYLDEKYKIVIQGYNPTLVSAEFYQSTAHINTTVTKTKKTRFAVILGLQAGYGYTPKGWQPYVGGGVSAGFQITF